MKHHDSDAAPLPLPLATQNVAPRGSWPRLPGSKSLTQRYYNLALLGGLRLAVRHPLDSEDTRHYLQALEACGCRVERHGGNTFGEATSDEVRPGKTVHIDASTRGGEGQIFCGAGGTMMRFLTAALTVVPGRWHLDGIPRLRERPLGPLIDGVRQLRGDIRCLGEDGFPPLEILGGSLQGGEVTLDAGASSQFLSALLMAALAVPQDSIIRLKALTSQPYVNLTLDAIAELGGEVEALDDETYRVRPGGLRSGEVEVEADFSAVAYPAAAAAVTGGEVRLAGLRRNSRQGDRGFLDLLERMGAQVHWQSGEHGDELRVIGGALEALDVDMSEVPDQVPTLAAIAPFANGTTVIRNVPHLRIKESDRLQAMAQELDRAGAVVRELPDGLEIDGIWHRQSPPSNPVVLDSHGDHRIAMSMALVGLRRPGMSVSAPGVVAKSYPSFWDHLRIWLAGNDRP